MGFWSFTRRKDKRKTASTLCSDEKQIITEKSVTSMTFSTSQPTSFQAHIMESPRTLKKERKDLPRTRQENENGGDARAMTNSPERQAAHAASRSPLQELNNRTGSPYARDRLASKTSLGRDADFSVIPLVPTLRPHASTKDSKMLRKKSSKRKADDKQRVQSLRAGSSPVPIPASKRHQSTDSGGLLVRESKRLPRGPGRPSSQVSIPLPESLNDSIPDVPESTSFKVNAFDVLSPYPTIKYNNQQRPSLQRKDKERASPIPEGDWSAKSRMNELADDLDARALRELMDRDRRRRERKRKLDTENLARKLEKREQKDRAQRAKGKHYERVELGQDSNEPIRRVEQTPVPESGLSLRVASENPFVSEDEEATAAAPGPSQPSRESPISLAENPFQEPASAISERDEPVIETARAIRLSQASISPPASPTIPRHTRGPSMTELQQTSTPDIPELPEPVGLLQAEPRRDSGVSSRTGSGGGWTSFFRRAPRRGRTSSEKDRATPSDSGFSNTSRESFMRQGGVPPSAIAQRSFKQAGKPQRRQSKFREDLPDAPTAPSPPMPMSPAKSPPQTPPQTRPLSADLELPPSPYVDRPSMLSTDAAVMASLDNVHPALREEVALSRGQSTRSHRDSGPSAAVLSQSLASVDSEGSWLSGRPSKRSSSGMTPRASAATLDNAEPSATTEAAHGSPLIFGRRISNPQRATAALDSSITSQLRAARNLSQSSDTREVMSSDSFAAAAAAAGPHDLLFSQTKPEPAIVHNGSLARSPTVVRTGFHGAHRSREGLLDIFDPPPAPSSAAIESSDGAEQDPSLRGNTTIRMVGTSEPPQRIAERVMQEPASPISPVSMARTSGSIPEPQSAGARSSDSYEDAEAGQEEAAGAEIQRATSVSLTDRHHARHMSAGSARLLELPPRSSGEIRWNSRRGSHGTLGGMVEAEDASAEGSGEQTAVRTQR